MGRTLFRELRAARQSFAVLAALLLSLPVLLSTLPRPALADAMAELSGYSICSTVGGLPTPAPAKPSAPCENCLAGVGCAVALAADPLALLALLLPERRLAGALHAQTQLLKKPVAAAVHSARGPPFLS